MISKIYLLKPFREGQVSGYKLKTASKYYEVYRFFFKKGRKKRKKECTTLTWTNIYIYYSILAATPLKASWGDMVWGGKSTFNFSFRKSEE